MADPGALAEWQRETYEWVELGTPAPRADLLKRRFGALQLRNLLLTFRKSCNSLRATETTQQ